MITRGHSRDKIKLKAIVFGRDLGSWLGFRFLVGI